MVVVNYEWVEDPAGVSNIAYNVGKCFRLVAEKYNLEGNKSNMVVIKSPELASMFWRTNCFFQGDLAEFLDLYGSPGLKVSIFKGDGTTVPRENGFDPVTSTYDEHYDKNLEKFIEQSRKFETIAFRITHK